MRKDILSLYEQNQSICNLYVSIANKEIFNSRQNNASDLINIRSMTKSIVSLIVGIALKEGYIKNIETEVKYYLPDAPSQLTVRDLLTMSSGFDIDDKDLYGLIQVSKNWVKDILALPVKNKGDFRYKGVDYHLLSVIISKSTGLSLSSFAQSNFFSPLGINKVEWQSDPQSITVGSTGLKVSFEGLIKISHLLINNGVVNERQVVPKDWINYSTSNGITTNYSYGDYGFGWWLKTYKGNELYLALGSGGQQLMICPAKRISIIITADTNTFSNDESETLSHKILDIIA